MDEHGASVGPGDRVKRRAELGDALPEEFEVHGARAPHRVDLRRGQRLDAGPELSPRLGQHRHVDDVERQVARRIRLELAVAAKVDHGAYPVGDQRGPAVVRQTPDAVGTDDDVELRLATVVERQPAQVPHVDAAVPPKRALAHGGARRGRAQPARPSASSRSRR